ncbi:hypothetical protein C1645_879876 [Glomus cerebriforme]|uniref:F-box domain-containing protein n=1 Tax=Glomus cerebriforme TaxID=658196 RepID=A0A397SHY7_9GLOM|nr:hypothetical protein C1645_879876 [Glomus cerebriforme]
MLKLNRDVLYLIFKELEDDIRTLYLCLLVNKTWCNTIIPILWKNPWKYYLKTEKEKLLLDVIISHLSDKSKNYLRSLEIQILETKPLFDYISYCKHLNLNEIIRIIDTVYPIIGKYIIKNEVFILFIDGNTKFTHLYIPLQFNYPIHLIPGAKFCFSEVKFLSCNSNINNDILIILIEICKSIKEMNLFIELSNNNYGIVKLIEVQKKIQNIRFITYSQNGDESFRIILENSLIKHVNTIQYFKMTKQPITKILSCFVNLKILELDGNRHDKTRNCLENLSLPYLQILKAKYISVQDLESLIKSTSGQLIEIKIEYPPHSNINNKRIIQAIYQNCPNLEYLQLFIRNSNILELEKLLINCQYLNGLYIHISNMTDVDRLFEIITKSSPANLFKFKFHSISSGLSKFKSESLKLFFDNWKNRHPILLQTIKVFISRNVNNLIEKYKASGIIKKYDNDFQDITFDEFEWIQKKSY